MKNFFCTVEWPEVRQAYEKELPEALPWERWCTDDKQWVRLPIGELVQVDRGAGQGEPDGPLRAT